MKERKKSGDHRKREVTVNKQKKVANGGGEKKQGIRYETREPKARNAHGQLAGREKTPKKV